MHFSLSWVITPYTWTRRKVRKHFVDKAALVRDGAEVITPAIDSATAFAPVNVSIGSQEEIRERMAPVWQGWHDGRKKLLTYLNSHPSDEIRTTGKKAVEAVTASSSATHFLFQAIWAKGAGFDVYEAHKQAKARNAEAVQAMNDLMDAVRAY